MSKKTEKKGSNIQQENVEQAKGEALRGGLDLFDVYREAVEADLMAAAAKLEYDDERERSVGTVAEHLMQLARKYKNAEQFVDACKLIEKAFKGDDMVAKMRKIDPQFDGKSPRCWTQAKSNIKAAWGKYDIDPAKCETAHQLRKKLDVARRAEKAENHPTIEQAKDAEVAKVLSPLANVLNALAQQKDSKAASDALDNAVEALKQVHKDAHKVLNNIMKNATVQPKGKAEQKAA